MRPITVSVGPLVTASATNIATAQRNLGAGGAMALIGTLSNFVAGTVAATQAPGASALTINGTRANTGVAYTAVDGSAQGSYIYITSSGNDSGITFAVVGTTGLANIVVTETITGSNAQSVASVNSYNTIISITPSGAVAANVTVGTFTKATLDTPRFVLVTTAGADAGKLLTLYGIGPDGVTVQSEVITLVSTGTVASVLAYTAVTKATIATAPAGNVSLGTTTTAASPWVRLDPYANGEVAIQLTASGTVNYTLQQTLDDPNTPFGAPVSLSGVTWVNTNDTNAVNATTSIQSNYQFPPVFARILLNSGSGSVTGTFSQSNVVSQ